MPRIGPIHPELPHRHIRDRRDLKIVKTARPVRLDRKLQLVRMTKLAEVAEIILRNQIGDQPPEIPEKPLARIEAVDDPPRQHGQISRQLIAQASLERLLESF